MPTVFENVTCRDHVGSLQLGTDELVFKPKEKGRKTTSWEWSKVKDHRQGVPSPKPKWVLKFSVRGTIEDSVVFSLSSQEEVRRLDNEAAKLSGKELSEDDTMDVSSNAPATSALHSSVGQPGGSGLYGNARRNDFREYSPPANTRPSSFRGNAPPPGAPVANAPAEGSLMAKAKATFERQNLAESKGPHEIVNKGDTSKAVKPVPIKKEFRGTKNHFQDADSLDDKPREFSHPGKLNLPSVFGPSSSATVGQQSASQHDNRASVGQNDETHNVSNDKSHHQPGKLRLPPVFDKPDAAPLYIPGFKKQQDEPGGQQMIPSTNSQEETRSEVDAEHQHHPGELQVQSVFDKSISESAPQGSQQFVAQGNSDAEYNHTTDQGGRTSDKSSVSSMHSQPAVWNAKNRNDGSEGPPGMLTTPRPEYAKDEVAVVDNKREEQVPWESETVDQREKVLRPSERPEQALSTLKKNQAHNLQEKTAGRHSEITPNQLAGTRETLFDANGAKIIQSRSPVTLSQNDKVGDRQSNKQPPPPATSPSGHSESVERPSQQSDILYEEESSPDSENNRRRESVITKSVVADATRNALHNDRGPCIKLSLVLMMITVIIVIIVAVVRGRESFGNNNERIESPASSVPSSEPSTRIPLQPMSPTTTPPSQPISPTTTSPSQRMSPTTTSPSQPMSPNMRAPSQTPSHRLQLIPDLSLPDDTIDTILEDPLSPQYQAYAWLTEDPFITGYPPWRKLQRFALATFFYAFNGDTWPENSKSGWLEYGISECYWLKSKAYIVYSSDGAAHIDANSSTHGTNDRATEANVSATGISGASLSSCNSEGNVLFLGIYDDSVGSEQDTDILRGTMPPEVSFLTSLEHISIRANTSMKQILPRQLRALSNLRNLDLSDCNFRAWDFTVLPYLQKLEILDLSRNAFQGPFLTTELGFLTNLQYLDLSDSYNTVSAGSVPTEIALLTNLRGMYLSDNVLSGSLPSHVGLMESLEQLYLDRNLLYDSIPTEIGMARSLTEIQLDWNLLTGGLPSEIFLLSSLSTLSARGYSLRGTLSTEIGKLKELRALYLSGNDALRGALPSEMGLLPLVSVSLNFTSISGTIPTEYGLLSDLSHVYLSNTDVTGTVPAGLCSLSLDVLAVDCTEVVCVCDCACY